MKKKIKSIGELTRIVTLLKKEGKKIVFTNGCFDIIHSGHIKLLRKSKSLGNILIVGLNSDRSIKRIKDKSRPINRAHDRAFVLSSIDVVDFVTIFNESTPEKTIKSLSPDVLVKGGDWKKKEIVGSEFVLKNGGKVVSVKFVKGYSTSDLIKRLKNG